MKKEVFYLKNQPEPFSVETCEPLIIWTICINNEILLMPEFHFLINSFYFKN